MNLIDSMIRKEKNIDEIINDDILVNDNILFYLVSTSMKALGFVLLQSRLRLLLMESMSLGGRDMDSTSRSFTLSAILSHICDPRGRMSAIASKIAGL